jgi:hypothetical protein
MNDYEAYLAANPDVAAAVARGDMTADQHYNNYGKYEGRDLGGSTSGAQQHFYENQDFLQANPDYSKQYIGGPGREAELRNMVESAPGKFSAYQIPVNFQGTNYQVSLPGHRVEQLQSMLAADPNLDFNQTVLRLAGDGIGTYTPSWEEGMDPRAFDIRTGEAGFNLPHYFQSTNPYMEGAGRAGKNGPYQLGSERITRSDAPPPVNPNLMGAGPNVPGTTIPPGGSGGTGGGTGGTAPGAPPATPTTPSTPAGPSSSEPPIGMMGFWQQMQQTNPQEAAKISALPSSQQTRALVQAYRQYLQQRGTGLLDIAKRDPFTQGFQEAQAR